MSKAEEFRKKYLGLENYNHTATLTGLAIDEMLQAYADQEKEILLDFIVEADLQEELSVFLNKLNSDQ